MMRLIIKFIKDLDPQNEVSNLNPFRLTDDEHIKVLKVIKQWANDGMEVPQDFIDIAEFSLRYV